MKIDIQDLQKVDGIGQKTIERIKEQLDDSESEYVCEYDPEVECEVHGVTEGDCLEKMNGIPDGSVDMVLCDPPYGTTQCSWDSVIPFESMWGHLRRIGTESCVFVFTASQPFSSALIMSNPVWFRHEWIWIKNRGSNFANTVREPMKEHESVMVFSKGRWTYNKQMQERTGSGSSRVDYEFDYNVDSPRKSYNEFEGRSGETQGKLRVPSSWQKFNTVCGREKTSHPNQKPVALFEYLIKTYTNEDDVVLDFAAGSGTTGVACQNLGREFILIEKDPEYCEVIRERLADNVGSENLNKVFS